MTDVEMRQAILESFKGVDVLVDSDNSFFFYNPDTSVPPNHDFPFTTIMTNDLNDQFSDLDRPNVFRVNIGIGKETFRSLFGTPKLPPYGDMAIKEGDNYDYDFTALDQLIPHPVYGRMYWVSILSPDDQTFEAKVKPLIDEAYQAAVTTYNKKSAKG